MSEMSEVSEELRVYAVRERKCWTKTEILDVLKEVEDYALDSPLPLFSAYDKLAEKLRAALEERISSLARESRVSGCVVPFKGVLFSGILM